jgi:aminobenzoyl-glutamate utilization protein A
MDFITSVTQERLVQWRRALHQHAEPALSEFWTAAFLAEQLSAMGCEVKFGPAVMDRAAIMGAPDEAFQRARMEEALAQGASAEWLERMDGLTGLVVDIRPDLPLHSVLRFDFDAVDVEESSDDLHLPAREGFRSVNPGRCHACGHDGHAAIGLGTAYELMLRRDSLKHNVRLIFEPAEEATRGAEPMVAAGMLDGARYFFSAHIGASRTEPRSLACGTYGFLATTRFDVEYRGRAAHAGIDPHIGRDSLLAAATAVVNMHAIPRHGRGETRIGIGRLEGGTGRNVIASFARLECETRGATTAINDYMFESARRIAEHTGAMYEQECDIRLMGHAGSADSDAEMCELVRKVSTEIPYFDQEKVVDLGPGFASDDVCAFIEAVQKQGGKGTYAQIGSRLPAGHHNEAFDFDEELLLPAVELFSRMALALDDMD